MIRRTATFFAACAGAALLPVVAAAQTAPDLLPLPGDPVEARIERLAPPEVAPAAPALEPSSTGTAFLLNDVELIGATAIPPAELRPLWANLLGQPVTLTDLETVAAAISARYRAEGYVLSQAVVPAQTVEAGVVRIQLIEGFVDRVSVEGGSPVARASAERRFARMAEARPLGLRDLERAVLLSRDTLGGTVETVVAPSVETFGAADMTVLLEPDPVVGFAALDTRGSRLYSDVTASAGLTAFGTLGLAERLDLLLSGDPLDGRVGYLRGDAAFPLAAAEGTWLDGAVLALRADLSTGEPEMAVEDLRLVTDEAGLGATITVPFVRTREQNLSGRIGLDWRRSDSLTTFDVLDENVREELLVLETGFSWDRADRLGGVTLVDVALRQGLDVGAAEVEVTGPAAASAGFTRLFGRLARLQSITEGWSAFGEAIWQIAPETLPGSERFSLGGSTIGRGFAPGNTTGDSGFGVRLEVRRGIDGLGEDRAAEIYGFADYGRARDHSEVRDGDRWEDLSSVGVGARVDLAEWVTLTPELVRQTSGRSSDRDGSGLETRAFLGVVARF